MPPFLRLLQDSNDEEGELRLLREPAPDPRESLTPIQKVLTSAPIQKILDMLPGAKNLPESEAYGKQKIQDIMNIPAAIPSIAPWTPLEQQEKSLGGMGTALETLTRVPSGLMATAFPQQGQNRIQALINAMIRPDKIPSGYLAEQMNKSLPPPQPGTNLAPRIATTAAAGTLGELLSYEFGSGMLFKRLAQGYQSAKMKGAVKEAESILEEATKKAVTVGEEKGIFPPEWTPEDKIGRTKVLIREKLFGSPKEGEILNPQVSEALLKKQTPAKILTESLRNEKGMINLPKIPEFKNTEEAIAFGKKVATQPEIIAALKNLNESMLKKTKELRGIENPTDEQLQEGMNLGTRAQFYREALEAAEPKNISTPEQPPSSGTPKPEIVEPSASQGQEIVTDPTRIQEIKNSIAEGEMILKSGKKTSGRKMSSAELEVVKKSVDNAKAKIGQNPNVEQMATQPPASIAKPGGQTRLPPEKPSALPPPSGRVSQLEEVEKSWEVAEQKELFAPTEKPSLEDQAQMELEIIHSTGGQHPLEAAIKQIGKVAPYQGGKELEEHKEIPVRFRSPKGKPLDEVRQELQENFGIVFESDSELRAALKDLGDSQQRFTLSKESQTFLRNKANVEKLGKILEGKISPSAYRKIIYSNVGLKYKQTPFHTTKEKMLKYILAAEQRGGKTGYKEGKKLEKARNENKWDNLKSALERRAELNRLKQDIQSRVKIEDMERNRAFLVDYVREKLPPNLRFKLLPEIRDVKTSNQLGNAILKIEKISDEEIARIKKIEESKRFTPEQRKELYQSAYGKGLIIKLENGKVKDKLAGILHYYKDASFSELKNYLAELQGAQDNPSPKILKLYGDPVKDAGAMKLINESSKEWQDLNEFEVRTLDPVRQSEKVSGLDAWDDNNVLTQNIFDVISGADAERFDRFNKELKELADNSHGILRDTKASAEIMRKFETGESMTEGEKKVLSFLRSKYDMLITEANAMRKSIGKKPIPYRQDYMTHIQEYNLLTSFFKGDVKQMEGITNDQLDAIRKGDFTKGNMKFNQFAQKRFGKKTKYDAIGNYEKYIETLLYEIYMTPAVTHARKFSDYALLKFPRMFEATTMLLNRLAGKPSSLDKLLKPVVSNKMIKWLRARIAKNALVGNLNFNLVNAVNWTTSAGELGNYTLKGLVQFLGNRDLRKLAFEKSSVLKSRKNQFDADVKAIDFFSPEGMKNLTVGERAKVAGKQLEYLVEGITRVFEYNNVGSSWVGAYLKAIDVLKFSPEKAYKYADTIARRTQAGYRPYELPEVMASDSGKTLLQFQTWTFNAMNHILYDLKLGNIPKQFMKPFSKNNQPDPVYYRKFIVLLGTMMLFNEVYKRFGWREPTSPASVVPRVSFPMGRVIKDVGTVSGADNLIKKVMGDKAVKHKEATMNKARTRLMSNLFAPYGGAQLSRFLEGRILPDNRKEKESKVKTKKLRLLE